MTISFGEIYNITQQCFAEQSIQDNLISKLQSITIIRDVKGKIRVFLEPLNINSIKQSEISDLNSILSTRLGYYYGNDIWLPKRDKDSYQSLIETIKQERVSVLWDDQLIAPRWYVLERHIAKQAWTDKKVTSPPWAEDLVDQGHKPADRKSVV